MYTVIVVDDELAIRENLPKVIRFEKYGFRVCATAKNGAEALTLIRSQRPNLIMVDICMPTLDGLGLIEAMNKEGYGDIPVIILSGHSDFDYAKQAVKYNVKAYLTKPVDEEETESLLEEIAQSLELQKKKNMQEMADRKKHKLSEMFVAGKSPAGFSEDAFLHCVVLPIETDDDESTPYQILQTTMPKVFSGYDFLYTVSGYYYSYYLPADYLKEKNFSPQRLAQQAYYAILKEGLTCAVIADTQILQEEGPFYQNFNIHKNGILTPLFYGAQSCHDYERIPKEKSSWKSKYSEAFLTELGNHLNEANLEGALSAFDHFCETIAKLHPTLPEILDISHKIFYALSNAVQQVQQEGGQEYLVQKYDWQNSTYFFSLLTWAQIQKQTIKQAGSFIMQSKKMNGFGQYDEILDYVRRHYREPITIKEVADRFFVNAAYLGRMFQKTTGVGFKQYVKDLRFAEAKQILSQTDKRVYEIAGMVGFSDSNYFIAKFTQEMGISPTEYRKKRV
ncbi:response regulator transcription factor [Scatolibacter rhodanostii]|uniref:response regulator transcription factor n=1 Tax=Scatolibacter rhodanostii TaxID=2014781 RepID=UPI000C070A32|nr:response regulator [Scatolibacter rhodanostii]